MGKTNIVKIRVRPKKKKKMANPLPYAPYNWDINFFLYIFKPYKLAGIMISLFFGLDFFFSWEGSPALYVTLHNKCWYLMFYKFTASKICTFSFFVIIRILFWKYFCIVECTLLKCVYQHTILNVYSVMQSDGNSFYGNVVSNRFDKAYWDEDNILDQISKNNYVCII